MKIHTGKYDKLASKMCRDRDEFTCQVCGKYSEKVNAHHVLSRSVKALRFEPFNLISLCAQCHTFSHNFSAHKTPEAFRRWFKKRYPDRWNFINKRFKSKMTEREAIKEFEELLHAESNSQYY